MQGLTVVYWDGGFWESDKVFPLGHDAFMAQWRGEHHNGFFRVGEAREREIKEALGSEWHPGDCDVILTDEQDRILLEKERQRLLL